MIHPQDLYRPYVGTNHNIQRREHRTSCDKERKELRVYEYRLGEHWVMWDRELGLVYWTGIWQAIGGDKIDLPKALNTDKALKPEDMLMVRGGKLTIQGTWIPYPNALKLAIRTCYKIRHELVPLFGPQFVDQAVPPDHPEYMVPASQLSASRRRQNQVNLLANGGPGPVRRPAGSRLHASPKGPLKSGPPSPPQYLTTGPYPIGSGAQRPGRPRGAHSPARSLTPHIARAGTTQPSALAMAAPHGASLQAKRVYSLPSHGKKHPYAPAPSSTHHAPLTNPMSHRGALSISKPYEHYAGSGASPYRLPSHNGHGMGTPGPSHAYSAAQSPHHESGSVPSEPAMDAANVLLSMQRDDWRRPPPHLHYPDQRHVLHHPQATMKLGPLSPLSCYSDKDGSHPRSHSPFALPRRSQEESSRLPATPTRPASATLPSPMSPDFAQATFYDQDGAVMQRPLGASTAHYRTVSQGFPSIHLPRIDQVLQGAHRSRPGSPQSASPYPSRRPTPTGSKGGSHPSVNAAAPLIPLNSVNHASLPSPSGPLGGMATSLELPPLRLSTAMTGVSANHELYSAPFASSAMTYPAVITTTAPPSSVAPSFAPPTKSPLGVSGPSNAIVLQAGIVSTTVSTGPTPLVSTGLPAMIMSQSNDS
ncbi:hypothetical protein H4R34_000169 [Dimargaris verticillata]|uniref:HTH APSES-type domain-containing protein n=1 Tax=Dimargaris verticillata TaxID=2761393 RepID=A0A9W8BCE0_9FUNG|nr:hypothetical protein H4R34_000169 [Dimargaris verticillata]